MFFIFGNMFFAFGSVFAQSSAAYSRGGTRFVFAHSARREHKYAFPLFFVGTPSGLCLGKSVKSVCRQPERVADFSCSMRQDKISEEKRHKPPAENRRTACERRVTRRQAARNA